ncbi:MAG: V-type ATP synthase subunit F [bacterium]|nr:MAG: V-type ATP synthase subunit F [bacterium]
MSEILVIGQPEIVEGFSLAGADVETCSDPSRLEWRVMDLLRGRSHGIVIITEELYESLPEKVRLKAEESGRPLFITLPRPRGEDFWTEQEDMITRIIRRAIGYRLKIRR